MAKPFSGEQFHAKRRHHIFQKNKIHYYFQTLLYSVFFVRVSIVRTVLLFFPRNPFFCAYRFPTLHWEKVCDYILGNRPPFFFLFAFSFAPVLSPLHFLSLEKEKRKAEKNKLALSPPFLFPYIYFFLPPSARKTNPPPPPLICTWGAKGATFPSGDRKGVSVCCVDTKEKNAFKIKEDKYKNKKNLIDSWQKQNIV